MSETVASLSKLRVVDLKQRLSEFGLAVGGLKADLVQRLFDHLNAPNARSAGSDGDDSSGSSGSSEQTMEDEVHRQQPVGGPVDPSSPPSSDGRDQNQPMSSPPPHPPKPPTLCPPPLMSTDHPPPAPPMSLGGDKPLSISPLMGSPPLLSPTQVANPGLDNEMLMQHKVRQQQLLLEQQKKTQKQEDLFRMQQQALMEKQKERDEKQAHLLRLQQEAYKQNEDEQKHLQALGLKPPAAAATAVSPTVAEDNNSSGNNSNSDAAAVAETSRTVGAILAAIQRQQQQQPAPPPPPPQQQQQPPPSSPQQQQQQAPPAPLMSTPPAALLSHPPGPGQLRPPLMPPGSMGLMGHSPLRAQAPTGMTETSVGAGRGGIRPSPPMGPPMRPSGPLGSPIDRSPRPPIRHQLPVSRGGREDKPPPLMSLQVAAPPNEDPKDVRLPQALEEALAYKHQRAKQVGVTLEDGNDEADHDDSDGDDDIEEIGENDQDPDEAMEFNEWLPASSEMAGGNEWRPPIMTPSEGLITDTVSPGRHSGRRDHLNRLRGRRKYEDDEEESDAEEDNEEDEDNVKEIEVVVSKSKKDKLKKKKKKKKKKKAKTGGGSSIFWIQKQLEDEIQKRDEIAAKKKKNVEPKVEVKYIQEEIQLDYSDPMHRHFAKIFENFKITEPVIPIEEEKIEEKTGASPVSLNMGDLKKVPKLAEDTENDSDNEDDDDKPKISKRKLKLMRRMSIAELKQTVNRPDVVEMHDITARDPKLLVHLKATRNTVPVPRHWCFKRKYLQGKRGIEKPPFELPDFIKRTGIMEMRAALQEKEDQKTLKAKMRDKVRPKMGKIDIDYQKLHDAFFKWQCKPEMTIHGDLYYEGKEFETKMKDKKPGEMSDDLRIALGMPVGANAHKVPPPWLIAMQRYGPPPSYPNLKIPGLNAPIPDACSFGYHAGGWGKPPVDNVGKPIYGDVFGTHNKDNDMPMVEEEVEKSLWGELESESEEESEEEETSEEEEDGSGLVTPGETGLVTPSGISSLPAGLETPDMIELRKKHMETEMEGGETPALYTILPEKRVEGQAGRAMMGSSHTYDISSAMSGRSTQQGVEVALDPSELDLVDTDAMAARYEATLREQQGGDDEDFSDMVAEHAAKQRNKRRRLQHQEQVKPAKKYKDFKF